MSGLVQPGTEDGGLRVLITNCTLAARTGTELFVRDLALGLLERGHTPVVYSPFPGPIADEIRSATIPVVSDLASLGAAPDVIHGHHWPETLAALLAFPGVPALTVCHSWVGWRDVPFRFPRVLRYVAVDHTCRDRLRYDPVDAAEVSRRVRASAGLDAMLDEFVALYEEVIAEHRSGGPDDLAVEQRAAAAYLESLATRLRQRDELRLTFVRMFHTPVIGWLLRAYAARPGGGQLLELLKSSE